MILLFRHCVKVRKKYLNHFLKWRILFVNQVHLMYYFGGTLIITLEKIILWYNSTIVMIIYCKYYSRYLITGSKYFEFSDHIELQGFPALSLLMLSHNALVEFPDLSEVSSHLKLVNVDDNKIKGAVSLKHFLGKLFDIASRNLCLQK